MRRGTWKSGSEPSEGRDDDASEIHVHQTEPPDDASHTLWWQISGNQQDQQCWYTPFDPDEYVAQLSPVPLGKFTAGMRVWHPNRPEELGIITGFLTSLLDVLYPGGDKVLHHWTHLDVLSVGCYVKGQTNSGREVAGWVKDIWFTCGKVAFKLLRMDSAGRVLDKDAGSMVNLATVRICSPPWEWCTPPVWNKMPWVGLIVKISTDSENSENIHLVGHDLVVKRYHFVKGVIYVQVELDSDLDSQCRASQRVWVQYEHVVEARTGLRLLVFQPLRWFWRVNGPSDEYISNELQLHASLVSRSEARFVELVTSTT
ncbi:hypothetical protein BDZ89DRAFT_1129172 [Hymenopellis radicata]|nr:hypothetical protein BDZ89DRAFT_1129172 [Hymenopellis radicata]